VPTDDADASPVAVEPVSPDASEHG
jgi:hypothetical protein